MGASNIGVILPIWEYYPILDVILNCFLKLVFLSLIVANMGTFLPI